MPNMRLAAALIALALGFAGPGRAAEEGFFSAVEDLPVMPGLAERPDSTVVFQQPEGRIVEMTAEGSVSRDAVVAFYQRVLPQLGWTREEDGSFRREAERLRLAVAPAGGGVAVNLTITPE